MSVDTSDSNLQRAYEEILDQTALQDWLTVKYASKDVLQLGQTGASGLQGLKVALSKGSEETAQWGLLRLEGKFLLVSLLPEGLGGVRRARALVHARAVGALFAVHHSSMTIGRAEELSLSAVRGKLQLDGQAMSLPPSPNPQSYQQSPSIPQSPILQQPNSPTLSQKSNDGQSPRRFTFGSIGRSSKRQSGGHKSNNSAELSASAMQFLTVQASPPRNTTEIPKEEFQTIQPRKSIDKPHSVRNNFPQPQNSPPKQLPLPPIASEDLSASFERHTNMPSPIPMPILANKSEDAPVIDYLASRPNLPETMSARAVKGVPASSPGLPPLPGVTEAIISEPNGNSLTTDAEDVKAAYEDKTHEEEETRDVPAVGDTEANDRLSAEDEHKLQAQLAEERARARWEAETNERARLDKLERQRLESEEAERREATLRLQQEEAYRAAQAAEEEQRIQQERQYAADLAARKERERRMAEEARIAEEERQAKRLEEARVAANAKAQAKEQLIAQFSQLKDEGKTMLSGNVSVQGGGSSMIWRRRWFELKSHALLLYRSQNDLSKVMDTIDLSAARRPRISDGFEETQIEHSFKLDRLNDEDPYLFYCDEVADKELILSAIAIAIQ